MLHALRVCRALTLQTTVEILRQPLPVLVTTVATVMAALFPLLLAFQFGEEGRLVRDGILALHFTLGVYLAAVASSATLGRELQSGTGALVLTKAVSPEVFYLSKFLGVVLVLGVFTLCMGFAAVLSTRVGPSNYRVDTHAAAAIGFSVGAAFLAAGILHYRKGRPFLSTALLLLVLAFALSVASGFATGDAPVLGATAARLAPALVLVFLALAVMAALTLALAARLPPVPVVAASLLVFLLGLVNGPLLGAAAARGSVAAAVASALLPDWQHFWLAGALSGGGRIPASYVGWAALDAAAYAGGILLAGLALFRNREIGA